MLSSSLAHDWHKGSRHFRNIRWDEKGRMEKGDSAPLHRGRIRTKVFMPLADATLDENILLNVAQTAASGGLRLFVPGALTAADLPKKRQVCATGSIFKGPKQPHPLDSPRRDERCLKAPVMSPKSKVRLKNSAPYLRVVPLPLSDPGVHRGLLLLLLSFRR